MTIETPWYRDDEQLDTELRRARSGSGGNAFRAPAIPGYDSFHEIATGGQGVVYAGTQRSTGRRVAIKVLPSGRYASPEARGRFDREVDVAADLQHPGIVRIYDRGTADDGSPYFVMEFVDGLRLDEFLAPRTLTVREVFELFRRICDAVGHAHLRGIMHRDLKPANIRIDAEGLPHVLDFGLAKNTTSVPSEQAFTATGQFLGSLPWASPEQVKGDSRALDLRSDIYSLGVILYQILTGRFPYEVAGSIHDVIRNIVATPPAEPRSFRQDIGRDEEAIMLKCLAKDPAKRYQSVAELKRDVESFLLGDPVDARPASRWAPIMRTIRRHPAAATSAISLCLALFILGGTTAATWFLNLAPYDLVLYRHGQPKEHDAAGWADEARLVSRSERILATWGGKDQSIVFADLTESASGDSLAIVGYSPRHTGAERGSVCAYRVTSWGFSTAWQDGITDDEVLPELREGKKLRGVDFGVHRLLIADVFGGSDHAGDELVVVFSCFRSERIIRVYDLEGNIQYQVWRDGAVVSPYWMADVGLLVFAGDDASSNWDARGELIRPQHNPLVVFALRPEPQNISNDLLPSQPDEDPHGLVWTRMLYLGERPATWEEVRGLRLKPPYNRDPAQFAYFGVIVDEDSKFTVDWCIDDSGNEFPGSRVIGDAYRLNQALPENHPRRIQLPDPNEFTLRTVGETTASANRAISGG